jgi:hypothetical protein
MSLGAGASSLSTRITASASDVNLKVNLRQAQFARLSVVDTFPRLHKNWPNATQMLK